jgi:cell cycle sensor histidine kinase DivJ
MAGLSDSARRSAGAEMTSVSDSARRSAGAERSLARAGDRDLADLRCRSFITTHLIGGCLAAACLSAYVAAAGTADGLIIVALAWLSAPIALAVMVAVTGRLGLAHVLSAAHHSSIAFLVAAFTGGLGSFVIPWIIVVPVEAALSGRRRVIVLSTILALAALGALAVLDFAGLLPPARELGISERALRLGGLVSAGLYACLVAMTVEMLSRRSEDAARDGTALYRLMAENATDLISVHDAAGHASFVSHGAARLFAREPGDLLGAGFLDAVSAAERPAFLTAVRDAAEGNRETAVTYRFAGSDQGRASVWVETRCRPFHDEAAGGVSVRRVIAVTRDVSGARAREEELRRARDDARSASTAKSRFLATISHELRTPLNAIIGFSGLLAERLDRPGVGADGREFAVLIGESGEHLLSIVNDLLDMSRIEAGRYEIVPTPISIADIFRICAGVMSVAAAEADVSITTDPGEAIGLEADERAVKQIILNLLSNAVKFSRPGGTVSLVARAAGDTVEIEVADQGIGIAASDLARLGEPFVQAEGDYDRKYEGTGLGLSVVKGLAELHCGMLAIASAPGEGTTVTVRLPRLAKRQPVQNSGTIAPDSGLSATA